MEICACGGPEVGGGEGQHRVRREQSAETGPENVMVVVNRVSPESVAIADYYARKRSIPGENLCWIEAPVEEEISRRTYEQEVEAPIRRCLETGKLVDRIRYLVTTLGVPLKVKGSSGPTGSEASVDSELTLLYRKIQGESIEVKGLTPNPLYGQRSAAFRRPRFPIYLVTRLAAYTVAEVKAMIDRSLAATNEGVVVLDLNSEGDQPGNNWLRTAAILIPQERLVIDESPNVLYDQKRVIGYAAWGSNDPNRKRRRLGFEWLPGAIATTYVSSNGRTFQRPPEDWAFGKWGDRDTYFGGSPQSLTADLIEEGATGASGHVYEPYLHTTPRPDYLFPAYLDGRNLAESYYVSIPSLSWKNIVVGDPLCRLR